jgi:hypothetical protein
VGAVANAAALAVDQQFRNMALAGLVYTARTVLTEDPLTNNHTRRIWLATRVINAPTSYADMIAWTMAADPTIAQATDVTGVDETVLLNRIAATWDYLAGLRAINLG